MLQVSGKKLLQVSKNCYGLDIEGLIFNERRKPASQRHKGGLCTLMLSSRQRGLKAKGVSRHRRQYRWIATKALLDGIIHTLHSSRQRDAVYRSKLNIAYQYANLFLMRSAIMLIPLSSPAPSSPDLGLARGALEGAAVRLLTRLARVLGLEEVRNPPLTAFASRRTPSAPL
jgi:hypothetical protein